MDNNVEERPGEGEQQWKNYFELGLLIWSVAGIKYTRARRTVRDKVCDDGVMF